MSNKSFYLATMAAASGAMVGMVLSIWITSSRESEFTSVSTTQVSYWWALSGGILTLTAFYVIHEGLKRQADRKKHAEERESPTGYFGRHGHRSAR